MEIQRLRPLEPWSWFPSCHQFLVRHYGSILVAAIVATLVPAALGSIPVVGTLLSQIASSFLAWGLVRYLSQLEKQREASINVLFSILQDSPAMKQILLLVLIGALGVMVAFALAVFQLGAMIWFLDIPFEDLLKKENWFFLLSEYRWYWIGVFAISSIPFALVMSGVYYATTLISLKGLSLADAFRLSYKATLLNWAALLLSEGVILGAGAAFCWMPVFMVMASLQTPDFTRMLYLSVATIVIVILAFSFYVGLFLHVLHYRTYLAIFEGRPFEPTPVAK